MYMMYMIGKDSVEKDSAEKTEENGPVEKIY